MPRFRSENHEKGLAETRQKLLDSAVIEFSQQGFDHANINQISELAGLGKGTVYNYFPSKKELMLAAIKEISGQHHKYIRSRVLGENEPLERLKAFYTSGFNFVIESPYQARFMIGTMYSSNQEFKQAIYIEYRWMAHLIQNKILDYGKQKGVFKEVDPAVTAGLLMTLYLGSVAAVDENGKPFMMAGDVYEFILNSLQCQSKERKE